MSKAILKILRRRETDFYTNSLKTSDIKEYLEFIKTKGKYSYVADIQSTIVNNPISRGDFGKEVSMWTVNNYLRNIKAFYSYLFEIKAIKSNPAMPVKAYKHNRKPKSEIKHIDFNRLIKGLDFEYRDYVIIQLLLDTGMRIGETLALKTEDIDLERKALYIPQDKRMKEIWFKISLFFDKMIKMKGVLNYEKYL